MSHFHKLHGGLSAAATSISTTLVKVMEETEGSDEYEIEAKEDKEAPPPYQEKRNHLLPSQIILTRVRCMNKNHTVAIHTNGRLMLIDHPFRRKETEDAIAFKILGGEPPKCLQVLEAWKHLQSGVRYSKFGSDRCRIHLSADQHLIGSADNAGVDYLKYLPKDLQLALGCIRPLRQTRRNRAKIVVKDRKIYREEAIIAFINRRLASIGVVGSVDIRINSYLLNVVPGSTYRNPTIELPSNWFATVNKDAIIQGHFVLRREGLIPGYGILLQVMSSDFKSHRAVWFEAEKKLIYVIE